MATYLITGTSRSYGLALVQHLLTFPSSTVSKIFATSRNTDVEALKELAEKDDRVVLVDMDVTDEKSIQSAAEKITEVLGGKGLDVLINSAGICEWVDAKEGIKAMYVHDTFSFFIFPSSLLIKFSSFSFPLFLQFPHLTGTE